MLVPGGLLETISQQQDMLCRVLGECLFGDALDFEVGNLQPSGMLAPCEKKFAYVRYIKCFTVAEVQEAERTVGSFHIDNLRLLNHLKEIGITYATDSVQLQHLV